MGETWRESMASVGGWPFPNGAFWTCSNPASWLGRAAGVFCKIFGGGAWLKSEVNRTISYLSLGVSGILKGPFRFVSGGEVAE
jgi:hypothetical protein